MAQRKPRIASRTSAEGRRPVARGVEESDVLPRERVRCVIDHGKPDRIPIYGWVRANLDAQISAEFGSCDAFEDHYELDLAHLFGGPGCYPGEALDAARLDGPIDPRRALDLPMIDPNTTDAYRDIVDGICHHQEQRGRFVYVQTPGIFECLNGVFGLENHLAYLALYPDELQPVYQRQAEWNRAFAMNCIDLGVDMVHVSDDWGAQNGLLFSPKTWWELIHPNHKVTCDAVRARGTYLSLHSDGNVNAVIDGIADLGYQVVHPWQESAGMSLTEQKRCYGDRFVVMGGLDVQTTIGFGRFDVLRADIERVMRLFADGGLLFCTTHFVQDHCSMEELRFAFDTAYEMSRSMCGE
jgi:uroporphyrinogen decarboxylase